MKAVVILGSRNPKGQTADAVNSIVNGMQEENISVEKFFLPAVNLELCRQCEDSGWGICRSEGKCIINDDFEMLVSKIKGSDITIFATPVYFSDLSESIKSFLDRLRRTCVNVEGKKGIDGKNAIGICVAGGGGGGAPACIVNLEKIISRCGFYILDVIPVRRQNADLKADILGKTGEWILENYR